MTSRSKESSIKYQVRETVRPTVAPLTTAIGGALAAGTLQAATITVSSLDGGFVSGECTLRSALYAASTNSTFGTCAIGDAGVDIIEFDSALAGTINLEAAQGADLYYDGSTLPIGEDLRIYGDGRITINGSGNAPVFYGKYQADGLQAENIQFSGLTITGGGGDYGGAIRARTPRISVIDSTISGNTASISGGAIWQNPYGNDAVLLVYSSEISGNQSLDSNGGGGAIFVTGDNSAEVRFYDDSLVKNNVSLGGGGAIQMESLQVGFGCEGSEFFGNTAKYGNGGAVDVNATGGGFVFGNLRRCDVAGNSASQNGGGVAISGRATSAFSGLRSFGVNGSSFTSNEAGGRGGGFWIEKEPGPGPSQPRTLQVGADSYGRRSAFAMNSANDGGGGLYFAGAEVDDPVVVTISETDFISNEVIDGDGAGAEMLLGNSELNLDDVLFENNQALDGTGGGLQATSISGEVLGTNVRFLYNAAAGGGGARILSTYGDIGFERSVFRDNTAVNFYGGGLQIEGNPAQVGIGQTIVSGNSANFGGGGLDLFIGSQNAAMQIKYSEFSGNTTSGPGGGALISAGENRQLFLANSTVSGNSGSLGGAIRVAGDMSLEVKYSTIANNYATTGTGGLLTLLPNGCDISNSILAGNTTGPDDDPEDLRGIDDLCDVRHSLVSGKYSEFNNVTGNVLYQDPRMDPLADNGGSGGRTHALRADSPAIDAGDAAATAPSTDQRGSPFVRIFGSEVDMGAYERQDFPDAIFSDRFESP